MTRTETVTLTNMCMIYDDNGNILVQNRKNTDWPGITFPGGHVEPGEPFADAVVREILEETGLKISNPVLCGVKDWIIDEKSRYMVLLYKTNSFFGQLRSSDEGEMLWIPTEEIYKMNLANDMEELLEIFMSDSKSEQFFEKINGKWRMKII
ncbi:MAG: 8-oxo-dGTP diphosphatase [Acutalibacteraceae bacterium]|nr:8-oxo-dGTP diphosphatase [Acutalibacteraceae bacterium]